MSSVPDDRASKKKRKRIALDTMKVMDVERWTREQKTQDDDTEGWYRHGLMNQVAVLLGEKTNVKKCKVNDARTARHSGKNALYTHVLKMSDRSTGCMEGSPFVGDDPDQHWGAVPVQSDSKFYYKKDDPTPITVREFSIEKFGQQIALDLDAYDREQPGHKYFYITGRELTMFAADVDAPNITEDEFYYAIKEFVASFRCQLASLGFNEDESQRVVDWMGVYESYALPRPDPSTRTKRSVHIHCHVFGPVATKFEHFAAFLTDKVLPGMPAHLRTLFDIGVYSNGRAFRALGQSKLPMPGCPDKALHIAPVTQLSGDAISYVWQCGLKKIRYKYFLLATAHPAVVMDDNIPGSSEIPAVSFVHPSPASDAKRAFGAVQSAEQHLHWEMIVEPLFRPAYDAKVATDPSFAERTNGLLRSNHGNKTHSKDAGFAELWRRYNKKGTSGLHALVHGDGAQDGCAVSIDKVVECTGEHFSRFYSGEFQTRVDDLVATLSRGQTRKPRGAANRCDAPPPATRYLHAYHIRVDPTTGEVAPGTTVDALCRPGHFVVAISLVQGLAFMREMTPAENTAYAARRAVLDAVCLAGLPPSVVQNRARAGLAPLPAMAPWAPEIPSLRETGVLASRPTQGEDERAKLYVQDSAFETTAAN
jgi:hypothetical protein